MTAMHLRLFLVFMELSYFYLHQNQESDKPVDVHRFLFTGLFNSEKIGFFKFCASPV